MELKNRPISGTLGITSPSSSDPRSDFSRKPRPARLFLANLSLFDQYWAEQSSRKEKVGRATQVVWRGLRLRFAQLAIGAILGKKFANIPAHDLVTGRA